MALGLGIVGSLGAARDLADLSLEELLNESVTSVSKREQRLADAAASIAVLSNEDLRRSGATTIADALRLVPGLNVGSVNANQWAISARGFNNLYANKLLVLVDGRAVYTPIFAGVYWDMQQPMLEDVDRVEVIRGPGATVWGANAVNGVINVVTRSAKDTQGSLVYAGGGDGQEMLAGVRHGDRIGENTYYRVFATRQANDAFPLANGQPAGDQWHGWTSGFRLDHYPDAATHLTWQADTSLTDLDAHTSRGRNFNTLGRWTRELGERSSVEAQIYYDRLSRNEILRSKAIAHTFDATLEHRFAPTPRQDLVWGIGYRRFDGEVAKAAVPVRNGDLGLELFSAFVQDEFQLLPDKLTATAGVKWEHNDFTGFEVQPSARAAWKPTKTQTVWTAISRAVRTPSALEAGDLFLMEIGPPAPGPDGGWYVPTVVGNGNPESEVVWSYELGWRWQANPRIGFDLATFYNRYSKLMGFPSMPTFVPGVPFGRAELPFVNAAENDTYGGEATLTATPMAGWRLSLSHAVFTAEVDGLPSGGQFDPKRQSILRSSHEFGGRVSLDLQLRHVGGFAFLGFPANGTIASYLEADVRLAFRPGENMELSLVGQNLLDDHHPEQPAAIYALSSEVPRRIHGKITWRF